MNGVSNDGSMRFRLSKLLSGMSGSHLSICTHACKDDGHETNYFRQKHGYCSGNIERGVDCLVKCTLLVPLKEFSMKIRPFLHLSIALVCLVKKAIPILEQRQRF